MNSTSSRKSRDIRWGKLLSMHEVLHEQSLTPRTGTLRADLPGALAILCAIAFVTGVFDDDIREMLAPVLLSSFVGVIVFGFLYRRALKRIEHRLVVLRYNQEMTVRIDGPRMQEEFGPSFTWQHGVFTEHIDTYVSSRDAPVAWVQIRSNDGRILTIRRALGIHQDVPIWPERPLEPCPDTQIFSGQPVALDDALFKQSSARLAVNRV